MNPPDPDFPGLPWRRRRSPLRVFPSLSFYQRCSQRRQGVRVSTRLRVPELLADCGFPTAPVSSVPIVCGRTPGGVAALGAVREASGEELTDVSEDEELRVGRISLGQEGEEGGRGSRSVCVNPPPGHRGAIQLNLQAQAESQSEKQMQGQFQLMAQWQAQAQAQWQEMHQFMLSLVNQNQAQWQEERQRQDQWQAQLQAQWQAQWQFQVQALLLLFSFHGGGDEDRWHKLVRELRELVGSSKG